MKETFTLLKLNEDLSISFGFDEFSGIFLTVVAVLFVAAAIYSVGYMKGKKHLVSYSIFLTLAGLSMTFMAFAANLFTFYLNYELMTLCSAPLVMHDSTKEAITAGFKYLIYSFLGAYLVLFGFFVLSGRGADFSFVFGGTGSISPDSGFTTMAVFFMIIGFGVKAGMWPFHSWLTSAHPVAVSPASAILSGAVVNAGAAGIIRLLFYSLGPDFFAVSRFATAWRILTLLTVVMGSLLAFFEPLMKKRLAYSTISQMSYILFGLSLLSPEGYEGALLQLLAHAFAKCALFMIAGVFIKVSGLVRVSDFKGIGKKHPFILACYTVCALSMIGIPPTGGFIAKWHLLTASLENGGFVTVAGPVCLLVSALLTAAYLLPLSMKGYMPGHDFEYRNEDKKIPASCAVPIAVLTVLCVLVGIIPDLFLK